MDLSLFSVPPFFLPDTWWISHMRTNELYPTTSQRKLHWYQYRLRTLFVLMLLVGIGMSWLATSIRDREDNGRRQKPLEEGGWWGRTI